MSDLIDYGEPWGHKTDPDTGDNILVDRNGNHIGIIYEAAVWHRIKAESEALAGCPEPKAFVEGAREIVHIVDGGIIEKISNTMKSKGPKAEEYKLGSKAVVDGLRMSFIKGSFQWLKEKDKS